MPFCDDVPTFERTIERIVTEARDLDPRLADSARLVVDDRAKGPAYAVSTPEQGEVVMGAVRPPGLVFAPVYTGKAFHGLWQLASGGALRGARVLFVHTGGPPG